MKLLRTVRESFDTLPKHVSWLFTNKKRINITFRDSCFLCRQMDIIFKAFQLTYCYVNPMVRRVCSSLSTLPTRNTCVVTEGVYCYVSVPANCYHQSAGEEGQANTVTPQSRCVCVCGGGWMGACFALFYVFLRHVYLLETRAPYKS